MRLVIGGAFQGKKDYVKQTFHLEDAEMTDGATASYEDIFHCPCLYHFHRRSSRNQILRERAPASSVYGATARKV